MTTVSTSPPPSPPTTESAVLVVDNAGEDLVELLWFDFDGVERHYTTIASGQRFSQPTYVGHVWIFRVRGASRGWIAAGAGTTELVLRGPLDDEPMVPPGGR